MELNPVSTCQYLFGKEPLEVFPDLPLSFQSEDEKASFIEKCLDLAIRVHVFLFTHQNAILLLDPSRALNKECTLYAFMAARMQKSYRDETKFARTEDNRFLHLAFFLNHVFRDVEDYISTFFSTLNQMHIDLNRLEIRKKQLKKFLQEGARCQEKASRVALNRVFEKYMKAALSRNVGDDPLKKELAHLSMEDLRLDAKWRGEEAKGLYTYPKLAGLCFVHDGAEKEGIPIVVKVKVFTREGFLGVIHRVNRATVGHNDPVMVFSAYMTDGSCRAAECMEMAKHCPTYLYRDADVNKRHAKEEECRYCRKVTMDLEPFKEQLGRIMTSLKEVLLVTGADFMVKEQMPFLPFFQNSEKYPLLGKLFHATQSKLKGPDYFSIYHTFLGYSALACSDQFELDITPSAVLARHGFIQTHHYQGGRLSLILQEKGLTRLSRKERKIALLEHEFQLLQQGIAVRSKKERFPKKKEEKL